MWGKANRVFLPPLAATCAVTECYLCNVKQMYNTSASCGSRGAAKLTLTANVRASNCAAKSRLLAHWNESTANVTQCQLPAREQIEFTFRAKANSPKAHKP